jgi:transcriptional regulator with XRE-family HTH domain
MKQTRLKKRMTLRDLSIKTGIDASRLSKLERGGCDPTGSEVDGIAMILGNKIKFITSEESKKAEEELDLRTDAMMKAISEIKKLGFKKGFPGQGNIKCPLCDKSLSFTVASCNGHVWGCCSTKGCLSWMQ